MDKKEKNFSLFKKKLNERVKRMAEPCKGAMGRVTNPNTLVEEADEQLSEVERENSEKQPTSIEKRIREAIEKSSGPLRR